MFLLLKHYTYDNKYGNRYETTITDLLAIQKKLQHLKYTMK